MIEDNLRITKLDAARRQLRAALDLWFEDGDPIAIHTLAFAAYEIIHRLYKLKGLHDLIYDTDLIRDEYRGEYAKHIKRNANFFKHADRDPYGETEFKPSSNILFLLMSLVGLRRMGEQIGPVENAFAYWLLAQHPTWITEDILVEAMPIEAFEKLRDFDKKEILEGYLLLKRYG
jgi:hypothetical protein